MANIKLRRSMLFTPGDRYEMIEKAVKLNVDGYIIDWEDAVTMDKKEEARNQTERSLKELDFRGKEKTIRINSPKTEFGFEDLKKIKELEVPPDGIVVPKVDSAGEIELIEKWLVGTDISLLPLIETAKSILHLEEIASSSPRIAGLVFGGGDYTSDIGGEIASSTLLYPRVKIVLVASAAAVDAIDSPYLNIKDEEGLKKDVREAAKLGFDGKAVIHPSQIEVVNRTFSPSKEEIDWAEKVLNAYEKSKAGAITVNGEMVDQMTANKAKRILEMAKIISRD